MLERKKWADNVLVLLFHRDSVKMLWTMPKRRWKAGWMEWKKCFELSWTNCCFVEFLNSLRCQAVTNFEIFMSALVRQGAVSWGMRVRTWLWSYGKPESSKWNSNSMESTENLASDLHSDCGIANNGNLLDVASDFIMLIQTFTTVCLRAKSVSLYPRAISSSCTKLKTFSN